MFVVYITPFFSDNSNAFLNAFVRIPGVRLGVISQDPQELCPESIRSGFAGHWRVGDALSTEQLIWATEGLARHLGPAQRILAASEHIQVQVAEVRQALGIEGMDPETAKNFRDKARMKEVFQKAGIPCARHCGATSEAQVWEFMERVGYPVCVKPIDGAATLSTFRVEDAETMQEVLRASGVSPARPLQVEEFVTGEEHSFETISIHGKPVWHSLSRYLPTPLDCVRNPWIQYRVVLPREVDSKQYDDIRKLGRKAIQALGMQTGMTHMEWFRRKDGSIAISEVACRPPGIQMLPMINRANDIDMFTGWGRLMMMDQFDVPKERKYATGTAFLRGLGEGRVKEAHGLRQVLRDFAEVITDYKAPQPGQPKAVSYEGEGFIIVRHPETRVVEQVLAEIVNRVRVELIL